MSGCYILVPRAGLEPATYGLELRDSIQLSYRGEVRSRAAFMTANRGDYNLDYVGLLGVYSCRVYS